jgi:hypothetical protein
MSRGERSLKINLYGEKFMKNFEIKPRSAFRVMFLALALVLATTFAGSADENHSCKEFNGTTQGQITGPGTGQGTYTLNVNGRPDSANFTVSFSQPTPQANGTLVSTASHNVAFTDSQQSTWFSNNDLLVFTPTTTPGIFSVHAEIHIVSGTGKYEDACGSFIAEGTADFVTGQVVTVITVGEVCKCE